MASEDSASAEVIPQPATEEEYQRFVALTDSDEGWEQKVDRPDSGIWTRQEKGSSVNMLKARIDYADVEATTLYDVLHDPYYRRVWDENMVDGFEICRLDANNDIGYYSMRWPTPLDNRDYVNTRSWRASPEQYVIFNHSLTHPRMPPRAGFVRAVSFLSGYVIRPLEKGCRLFYVSHNDPKGYIPTFLINKSIIHLVPKVGEKIHSACKAYGDWKAQNHPEFKPWLATSCQDDLPDYQSSLSVELMDSKGKLLVQSTAEQGMNVPVQSTSVDAVTDEDVVENGKVTAENGADDDDGETDI
ncbi:START domain-containing protein 10-like [Sycon ciliatum]|uniref:START domain-containing protein 10-like n=1 Tax=Sycon ciliatum TaxID=27933 RepID=UPI0031F618FF